MSIWLVPEKKGGRGEKKGTAAPIDDKSTLVRLRSETEYDDFGRQTAGTRQTAALHLTGWSDTVNFFVVTGWNADHDVTVANCILQRAVG